MRRSRDMAGRGATALQHEQRNPENVDADPSHPEKQIHPAEDRERQQQDGKIAVGGGVEQLVQERTALRGRLPQGADNDREAKQDAECGARAERQGGNRWIDAGNSDSDGRKHAEVHDLIAAEIEPFAQARLFEQGAREIAVHAIDDRAKLEDERASHEISAREKPGRREADQDRNDRDLVRRDRRADEQFRKRPAKRAIEEAIDESVGGAGERGPKFAFRLGRGGGIEDQRRHRSGDDWLGMIDRHPHRKRHAFGGDQLSTLRDHIFQIAHFHENTALDQKRACDPVAASLVGGHGRGDMRWTALISQRLSRSHARNAPARRRCHDRDRRATGAMRGHHETIEDGQSRNFQAARPGIAHQDGGSLAHCAGLRLPPPKTPRSPK